jgi:hypothetical protein
VLNERAFITAAVRGDASSSFGREAKHVYYPKMSASWLLSDEPFFPRFTGIPNLFTNFRLRAAFGHAGIQPTIDARFRSYKSSGGHLNGQNSSGIVVSTAGNTSLRAERSTEIEGGFDMGLLNDRITVDLTMYRKLTRDALVLRTLPPSFGISSRYENIGKVDNRGVELTATVRPVATRSFTWNATVGVSHNRNRLVTLGRTTLPPSPFAIGTGENRFVEGYPVNGYWARPILGFSDLNADGVIDTSEVRLGDSALYRGQTFPKAELSWHNDFSLFSGWMSIATRINSVNGLTQLNSAMATQCFNAKCRWVVDPASSLEHQAIAVVGAHPIRSSWGYLETASWVRWSELSLTVNVPETLVRRLRTRSASVSLMGQNLGLWSSYRGADPEVNTNILGNQMDDMGGIPQPRNWSIRFNIRY